MADSYNELFGLGSHAEDAALEVWLPLQDDAASTVVDDISATNDDGVLQGGNNTADISVAGPNTWLVNGLDLDGAADYIDSMIPPVTGTGPWSILCRFRTADTATVDNVLVFWGTAGGSTGTQMWWSVENGVIWGRFGGNAVSGGSGYNDNGWHNLSAAKPNGGTAAGITLRVDKSGLTETPSGSSTLNPSNTNGLHVGSRVGSFLYNGDVADVVVFSRELTDAERDQWEDGPEPINSVAPAVSGIETEGETLSVTNGTWGLDAPFSAGTNGTIAYGYQWTRSDDAIGTGEADIGGATSNTYVLQAADVGKFIRCRVRATNDGGFDADADTNSDMTGAIAGAGGGDTRLLNLRRRAVAA